MRYFASSIMFALIIIVGVSCSSNDDQLENQAPSNFSIVIDTIGFDTASISWIKPQGENNESLDYTISLNNTIVAEQISEEGFTFTNLENAKMYDVEIAATNTQGVSTATTSFETLDIADFRLALDTYTIGNTVLTYYYDEVGNLIRRLNSNEFEKTHSYTYDSNG